MVRNKRKTETYKLDGRDVIRIYLNDESKICEMWLEDYNELVDSLKLNPNFRTHEHSNYVLSRAHSNMWLSVGRVLADANEGEVIKYRDGNPLNLRSDNLIKVPGASKRRDRDFIRPYMSLEERPLAA